MAERVPLADLSVTTVYEEFDRLALGRGPSGLNRVGLRLVVRGVAGCALAENSPPAVPRNNVDTWFCHSRFLTVFLAEDPEAEPHCRTHCSTRSRYGNLCMDVGIVNVLLLRTYYAMLKANGGMADHTPFYKQVGLRIREARKERGLSQDVLAKSVGLNRTSLSNVEKGRQKLLLHTFFGIAGRLGAEPNSLLPERTDSGKTVPEKHLAALANQERAFIEAALNQRKG